MNLREPVTRNRQFVQAAPGTQRLWYPPVRIHMQRGPAAKAAHPPNEVTDQNYNVRDIWKTADTAAEIGVVYGRGRDPTLLRFQRTLNRLGDSQFRIGFP